MPPAGMTYHPPRFGLPEFDEAALRPARRGRRWFVGWNGDATQSCPVSELERLAWHRGS